MFQIIKDTAGNTSYLFETEREIEFGTVDKDSLELIKENPSDYSLIGGGKYYWYDPPYSKENTLPSGVYTYSQSFSGDIFDRHFSIDSDKIFSFEYTQKIQEDFLSFRQNKGKYETLNLLYKEGILLYGPPGTGKTTAIKQIISALDLEDILVIYLESVPSNKVINYLKSDPRFKVFIFEELTSILMNSDVSKILNFLDGPNSVVNSFTITTTNYPEDLPSNIADRPGRFSKLYEVSFPTDSDIKKYFYKTAQIKLNEEHSKLLKNLPLCYLRDIITCNKLLKLSLDEAISKVLEHKSLAACKFKKDNEFNQIL